MVKLHALGLTKRFINLHFASAEPAQSERQDRSQTEKSLPPIRSFAVARYAATRAHASVF